MSTFLAVAFFSALVFFATAAVTGVFGPQLPVAKPNPGRRVHYSRWDDLLGRVRAALPMLPGCVVAASDPGDGPAPDPALGDRRSEPVVRQEGAGPLYAAPGELPALLYFRRDGVIEVTDDGLAIRPSTDAAGGASPYPAQTAPLAELREQMEPLNPARPFVLAEEYLP